MATGPVLLQAKGLRYSLGAGPLFEGVDLALRKGERAALVGANGTGKSTLMRMFAGAVEPDAGEIAFAAGATIALASQEPDLSRFASLRDYAMSPSALVAGSGQETPRHTAEAALMAFDLDPDGPTGALSGGETRRASLARAFARDPDVLLLDEPTNHLDIAAIQALEQRILDFSGACLVVSHDRRFLETVSTATLWLRQRRVIELDAGFARFDEWAERVETEEARAGARLETQLKAEEHWLRRGVTARRSRNEGRRRRLEAMRSERRERKALASAPKAALQADRGAESSTLVIDAKNLSVAYGERAIVKNFSLRVTRGDRIGVVGRNGAGKTTLLELLLGLRAPDGGNLRQAGNLQIAYVDQARAILSDGATLWQALAPQGGDQIVVRGRPRHVASYAGEFLFTAAQLRQPVAALSGGERNRLALAVALARPANLLVLDEPTNDLDMDTLDGLEDMLAAYDGTVILVSHDRAFLDGVATQIVGPLGDGRWVESPGGWSDFEREYAGAMRSAPNVAMRAEAKPAPAIPRKPRKLGYKDDRRAAELDDVLARLHQEIAALEARLAEPDAFARDAAGFAASARRLETARAELAAREAEWLELELRREALSSEE